MGITNIMQLGTFPVDKSNYDEIKETLVSFGLTPNQVKVFFYLGKIGPKTASDIAKAVSIPRSETYHLLTALQNKGMVLSSFQHPIKFSALPIQKAIYVLINAETERLNKLKKSGPTLEKLWNEVPGISEEENPDEEKFQVLQGGNQVNGKIFDMILTAQKECRILGSEKDFMKFYHANFLDVLEDRGIDYKLLTPISKKSKYIFDDMDKTKVKKICSSVKDNLCFLIKDDKEVLFFIKNAAGNNKEMRAICTNSETIIYSKALLFDNLWKNTSKEDQYE